MNGPRKIQHDLMCAFGFSRNNAMRARNMWVDGELLPEESAALSHLEKKDPFKIQYVPLDRLEPLRFPSEYIDVLNKLNLRISNGV